MSNRSIRWVIGFGVVAILAILTTQAYFFYQAFNLKERQTVQSLRISLQAVAESISRYNESTLPDNIIHEYSPEYFIVDINNHIDSRVLEHYLRSELTRRHLSIDFEYAIYNCDDDQMVYGNYVSLDEKAEPDRNKLQNWPKYEEGLYYFGVHFPGMKNFVLGEMELWYFFSAILVVVIIFFGYSMMIILQQKRLSEVQRDFINNMSHEFRTPLTSISLAANVLEEEGNGGDPERFGKYAAILKDQALLMQNKIEKVLQQAETEQRLFTLHKEPLLLNEFLADLTGKFRSRVEHDKGSISLDIGAGNLQVLADRTHFSGVLANLLDNAMKYTLDPPEIRIGVSVSGGKILLSVKDNGMGIDRKHIRRVFMPFFRVQGGNIHNVKGSGLGLSYVKKICDLHGWKVRLESEPGAGTTVTIIIPKIS